MRAIPSSRENRPRTPASAVIPTAAAGSDTGSLSDRSVPSVATQLQAVDLPLSATGRPLDPQLCALKSRPVRRMTPVAVVTGAVDAAANDPEMRRRSLGGTKNQMAELLLHDEHTGDLVEIIQEKEIKPAYQDTDLFVHGCICESTGTFGLFGFSTLRGLRRAAQAARAARAEGQVHKHHPQLDFQEFAERLRMTTAEWRTT